jgi:hypothetical protein
MESLRLHRSRHISSSSEARIIGIDTNHELELMRHEELNTLFENENVLPHLLLYSHIYSTQSVIKLLQTTRLQYRPVEPQVPSCHRKEHEKLHQVQVHQK